MLGLQKASRTAEMTLNITSLMDVLTIVLIFLVFNFSTDEQNVQPPKSFSLPSSTSERQVRMAVKVTLGPDDLRVEDRVVGKIDRGKIRPADLDGNHQIPKLLEELRREKQRLRSGTRVDSAGGEENDPVVVYLEAADGTPYELVDQVLKTSAMAGFAKFRLAVLRKF